MQPETIQDACDALARGEVVGVPTDTVYGLAIDPLKRDAYALLYAAKRRAPEKAIPLLVADTDQARQVGAPGELAQHLMDTHWPGGLTIVVMRHRDAPVHIGDPVTSTIALRAPDHPVALELLRAYGPLAVTSANISGEPPANDAAEARPVFGTTVAAYLDGPGAVGTPSTVVDATGEELLVLRKGAVEIEAT